MAFSIFKVLKGLLITEENTLTPKEIEIVPGGTASTKTTIQSSQTTNKTLTLPDATDTLVGKATTDVLTNKSIDADTNTITNIEDADIKALAAIDATKIADGSVTSAEFQYLGGVTSDIQTQLNTNATAVSDHLSDTTDAHDASAISNVPAGNLAATDVQAALDELQSDVDGRLPLSGGTMTGNIDLDNNALSNVPTPTNADHAANKEYVDSLAAGLDPKSACRVATTADLAATYATTPSNGQFTSAPSTIDAISLNVGDRVLVKDQTDAKENGIYVYTAANTLTRSSDMDGSPASEVSAGNYTFIAQGTINESKGFLILGDGILTLNTDDINWSQFSGATNTALRDLSNLTSPTAINQNLLPDINVTRDLGSPSKRFNSIYASGLFDALDRVSIGPDDRYLQGTSGELMFDWSGSNPSINNKKLMNVFDAELDLDAVNRRNLNRAVKNYIANHDAILDTTGYAAYADAAATSPVDGTGGSPNITITRSTSSPLRGVASFLITKDAANRQGEGVSYDFTIDSADQGKVLQGSFDYAISSGTYADDDMSIWIYDVTNARLIQPAPYLLKNHSLPSERTPFEFQTSIDSTSYRLIIHQASTSASAYTVKIDNVSVGPQAKLYGSAVTDWQDAGSISTTNISSTIARKKVRQVGDTAEYDLAFTATSAGSGVIYINLDKTIDLVKHPLGTLVGIARGTDAGIANFIGAVIVANNNTVLVNAHNSTDWATTVPFSWNTGDFLEVNFKVPIVGWSSSQIMSHDASTRVVTFGKNNVNTGTTYVSGTIADITWLSASTVISDDVGLWNGTYLTIKTPGYYKLFSQYTLNAFNFIAGAQVDLLWTDSSNTIILDNPEYTQAAGTSIRFSGGITNKPTFFNAGQTLKPRFFQATGSNASFESLTIGIEKTTGPAQIMASESVSAAYNSSSGQSIPHATTTIVDFANKDWDSTNSVTTGASWKFTAPISGEYEVYSMIVYATAAWVPNQVSDLYLFKNGNLLRYLDIARIQGSFTELATKNGRSSVKLLQGEYIDVRLYHQRGVATTLATGGCYIEIKRVGNY